MVFAPVGKTNRPLTIYVRDDWADSPVFVALAEKGHTIIPLSAGGASIIIHDKAHWCSAEMAQDPKLIEVALKWARKAC